MQLRSGLLVQPSAADPPPSAHKRKPLFQASPPKRCKSLKVQERNKNKSKVLQQKSDVYSYSSPHKLQVQPRPSSTQDKEDPTKSKSTVNRESPRARAPLTKKNLKIHSRLQMPRTRKVPSTKSAKDTSNTTTTTTDKGFGVQLNKNGVLYGRLKTKRPKDIDTVKEYLNKERQSNSPDEKAYNHYIQQVEWGDNELSVQSNTWHLLAKHPSRTDKPGYTANYNFQWTEVESPLAYGISDAKPDISEGYRWDQYPMEACEALGGSLIPTQYGGAMPTFCAEWKGPDGTMPSAEKQCAYDGALMVEAANHAHRYMMKGSAEFLDKTQALTLALNGEYVHLYSNHVIGGSSALEYHQYPLQIHKPRDSLKDFKETYRSIRNAQDWARYRATKTKDDLHEYTNPKVAITTTLTQQIDETKTTDTMGLWSAERSGHHGTLSDGYCQLSTIIPAAPAAASLSNDNSFISNLGEVRPQVKPKRKGAV